MKNIKKGMDSAVDKVIELNNPNDNNCMKIGDAMDDKVKMMRPTENCTEKVPFKKDFTYDFFDPNGCTGEAFCPHCHGSLKIKSINIVSSKSNESIEIRIKKRGMILSNHDYNIKALPKKSSEIIIVFQCRICKDESLLSIDDIAEAEGETGESITINRF